MVVALAAIGVKAVARANDARTFIKRVISLFLFEDGVRNGEVIHWGVNS
jgi:hypothetical protein